VAVQTPLLVDPEGVKTFPPPESTMVDKQMRHPPQIRDSILQHRIMNIKFAQNLADQLLVVALHEQADIEG
jgi:hypothetical protein